LIRFIYWFLVLLEVSLLLGTLLLFIVTDSRTIRYLADSTSEITRISYTHIEGNLFNGLEITDLRYLDQPLFSSATIHWNPLTLFYDKVTITQLDAKGIEVDNILGMLNTFRSEDRDAQIGLGYSFSVNHSRFDVNPFVYEGVKFSSVVLESGEIEVSKSLSINTKALYLKFDSDLVNLELEGKIDESLLLVEELTLDNIASKEVTKFSRRLREKNATNEQAQRSQKGVMPIKEIQIKHLIGTLKPVQYGSVKIKRAKMDIYDLTLNPINDFLYQAEKLDFIGVTNFGTLKYQGHIRDANIYAKGRITLDKELFKHYKIPLNDKAFKNLPSELRLNHDAVWVDIEEHSIKDLLVLESDFNMDLRKATHDMYYEYESEVFSAKSHLEGSMDYADSMSIESDLVFENDELSYEGEIALTQVKELPTVLSKYLIKELNGTFQGTDETIDMSLENQLLNFEVKMFDDYEALEIFTKSKKSNILLREFVPSLPEAFRNHQFGFQGESKIDLDDFRKSKVSVTANSNLFDIQAQMEMKKPYVIDFTSMLKETRTLEESFPDIYFRNVETMMGRVVVEDRDYRLDLNNEHLKLALNYNSETEHIERAEVTFGSQSLSFKHQSNGLLTFESTTKNLQSYFQELNYYYDIELPNLQGDAEIQLREISENDYEISIKSSHLKYLSEDAVNLSVTNFYDVELVFRLKNFSEIVLESYAFNLDDNEYLSSFFATKKSFLTFDRESLNFKKLWVNDEIIVRGDYNLKDLQGLLDVEAKAYKFRNKDFDLSFNTGLSVKLKGKRIEIDGDVEVLGNAIYYEVVGSGIVEDSDIILLEEMLLEKESTLKNIKLYLKIKSKKPLVYRSDEVEVMFMSDISVLKNYGQDMMVTGESTITKGKYQFEDKSFLINKSHLYFTGDLHTPLLDIKASYSKEEYNVHVFISGTTDAPIVNFNSEPFLTQQQIMSLILFDGTGSSRGTGAEAYTILGGTFAKGLIKSLGIDVDHFLLGQNEEQDLSLEIGKKISDDISILYLRKDGLDGVKVRVENSKHFETDIIIQPPNTSGIEFLYKQDR